MKRLLCAALAVLLMMSLASAEMPAWSEKWNEVVELKGEEARYLVKGIGLWSLVDAEGEVIEEDLMCHALPEQQLEDGAIAVMTLSGQWGYLLDTGEWLVEPQFDTAWGFQEGLALIYQDGKWGYIDRQGEVRIAPQFDYAEDFHNGMAEVRVGGLRGLIDSNGAYLIEPK